MNEAFKQKISLRATSWPTPQDYSEAVQNPQSNFQDPDLSNSSPVLDPIGLPKVASGMFASVYCLEQGEQRWAVRCFLMNNSASRQRYASISSKLQKAKLPSILKFELQENGIRSHGNWYPILKMEWSNGLSLNSWLAINVRNTKALDDFLQSWKQLMSQLGAAEIAHGDLQHGNILIEGSEIKLVDYDGMFVPELKGETSVEIGHRNYQHPARDHTKFGAWLDNFSAWLIYLSIDILKHDPSLWERFAGGDECILFRASDLQKPLESSLFYALQSHPIKAVAQDSWLLRYLLSLPIERIPPLEATIAYKIKSSRARGPAGKTPFGLPEAEIPFSKMQKSGPEIIAARSQDSTEPKKTSKQHSRKVQLLLQAIATIFLLGMFYVPSILNWEQSRQNNSALPEVREHSLRSSLENAQVLEKSGSGDSEAQREYASIVQELSKLSLDKEQVKLRVQAEQGYRRIYWKNKLDRFLSQKDQNFGPYSARLTACNILMKQEKFQLAAESYSRLINEMLANKRTFKNEYSLLELEAAYKQLGDCQEQLKNYPAALNAYLNAVHVNRDLFGSTDMAETFQNCLKVCQTAEKSLNSKYASKTYRRLMELTKDDPRFEDIYKQAAEGHSRLEPATTK